MNWETFMSWGDSITIGARSYLGYPEYVSAILEQVTQKFWPVVNCARCGFTAVDLLRYVTSDFVNLRALHPSVLTLLIGTNDLKAPTPPEDFRIAYNQCLLTARLIAGEGRILVLRIPELAQGVMYPYSLNMNATVCAFNAIITDLSRKHGVPLIGLHTAAGAFFDGVHLNAAGNAEVAHQVAEWILRERGLPLTRSAL